MNLLVGDLETSDSNVNSLSVLEASFCLYDDRFKEIGTPFHESARIRSTCVPSLGACFVNNIRPAQLKGANTSSFDLACNIYKNLNKVGENTATIGQNFIQFDHEALVRLFQRSLLPDIWFLKKLPRRMMDTLFLARAS